MNAAERKGRPKGQMTPRRSQVLDCIEHYRARGVFVSLSRIARECELFDYRDARRIVTDLRQMGAI